MKPIKTLLMALMLAGAPAAAMAATVTVTDGFVVATRPGDKNAFPYMPLTNTSNEPVTIPGFASPAAVNVMAHHTLIVGGVAQMQPYTPLTLQPGEQQVLTRRGPHIMLMGLNGSLNDGQRLAFTIIFRDGTRQELQLPIKQ